MNTITVYVNPYTKELVKLHGKMTERTREALEGQGVTEIGTWRTEDFDNWGMAAINRWSFTKVSKSARFVAHMLNCWRARWILMTEYRT